MTLKSNRNSPDAQAKKVHKRYFEALPDVCVQLSSIPPERNNSWYMFIPLHLTASIFWQSIHGAYAFCGHVLCEICSLYIAPYHFLLKTIWELHGGCVVENESAVIPQSGFVSVGITIYKPG